jgi:hypothetical protein
MQNTELQPVCVRQQAMKALAAFIDGDECILTPDGSPDQPECGPHENCKFCDGLAAVAALSKQNDNGDSAILRDQANHLREALTKIFVELGITQGDMPLSGPQLLLLASNAVEAIKQLKARGPMYSSGAIRWILPLSACQSAE